MPFPCLPILLSACFLLSPMYASAQGWPEPDRLQPDFSGGFHRPSSEKNGAKAGPQKQRPINSWRQMGDGQAAGSGWAPGNAAKPAERAPLLRFPQEEQDAPTILRRWRPDPLEQDLGTASIGRSKEGSSEAVEQSLPGPRVPADPRGGYGAVLQGRPVAPVSP
jgi:hypothetical protein